MSPRGVGAVESREAGRITYAGSATHRQSYICGRQLQAAGVCDGVDRACVGLRGASQTRRLANQRECTRPDGGGICQLNFIEEKKATLDCADDQRGEYQNPHRKLDGRYTSAIFSKPAP